MKEIITRYEILHIVSMLKDMTGKNEYQYLLNSLLGISPENIDKSILLNRQKSNEIEK